MTDLANAIQRGWATAEKSTRPPSYYFGDLLAHHPGDPHALLA